MKDPLDTLIQEAFPAEGQASAERLQLARRLQSGPAENRKKRHHRLLLCAGLLLITTGAMGAKVLLDRTLLFENGQVVGTATDMGDGSIRLDLKRVPTKAHPLNLEVRDEQGRLIGAMTLGVTTLADDGPTSPVPDVTNGSKPIRTEELPDSEPARSHTNPTPKKR